MVAPDVLTGVLAQVSDARPLSVAARQFADAGVPVFPCVPGGKRPLTEHGFHDATTDLDQIAAWWRQHPEANIAVSSPGFRRGSYSWFPKQPRVLSRTG